MIKIILSILSKLLTFFMWWKKKQDDPITQIQNERQQFQKAVLSGNANDVNAIIRNDLDKLRDKETIGSGAKQPSDS